MSRLDLPGADGGSTRTRASAGLVANSWRPPVRLAHRPRSLNVMPTPHPIPGATTKRWMPRSPLIWPDVQLDGRLGAVSIDVVSGGSRARTSEIAGKGPDSTASAPASGGKWLGSIDEVRPCSVLVENSQCSLPRTRNRTGDQSRWVLDAEWGVLSECHRAQNHKRERI